MDFDEFGDNFFVTKKINITMKRSKIKRCNNQSSCQIYIMHWSIPNSLKKLSLTIDAIKILRFL